MAYIKSHSNYVLKKEHQKISDGTIYERDITTIGGVNQFAPGQIPIYKSGNFIITVRDDNKVANQFNKTKWKESNSGNVWTLENVNEMTSEFEDQNDVKIVLKQDYYDFCDFVYYGSLSEMFRASITDIITRFPGELYGTKENAYYTTGETVDLESVKKRVPLGKFNATVKVKKDDESEEKSVENITYTELINQYGEKNILDLLNIEELQYYVDNPFGIDLHSAKKPMDGKPIKFFADNGYENYEIIIGEEGSEISNWDVTYYYYHKETNEQKLYGEIKKEFDKYRSACIGEKLADIKIGWKKGNNTNNITIEAWVGDNNVIIYLSSSNDFHIRPKESFIVDFYNNCDNFQRILLNRKTTPRYKSIFSVIKDTEFGYYREMEEFIFPTSYGGYNIDASSYGFSDFTLRLSKIGAYYDDLFTDNLYRSMTHEAIKNFDWSYTRDYLKGDEEDFIQGGKKIQKALRLFAREFDDILSYINNIKNTNRVTYDGRGNLPDYFLIDEVENKGWDVKLIYPYELTEYKNDTKEKFDDYSEGTQLSGTGFTRVFSQNTKNEIKPNPYSKDLLPEYFREGYFISCFEEGNIVGNDVPCYYSNYNLIKASASTYVDRNGEVRNRIKSYTDEKPYTYMDVNNEFLRRLAINSPHIFRHKGTVEGIEMLLALFGLKSKRWVDRMRSAYTGTKNTTTSFCDGGCNIINGPSTIPSTGGTFDYDVAPPMACDVNEGDDKRCKDTFDVEYDYEIIEYTSFAKRIPEKWDAVHQMYRIDWINSTKTIVYDYRSTSNYTQYGAQDNYVSYQGLPVSWRYDDEQYIKVGSIYENTELTTVDSEAFKNSNDAFKPVRMRYLYPNFNKYEQLDGNPYFQMDGGWLSKTLNNEFNFQFDADDNIASTCYEAVGRVTEDGIIDNKPIYKETIRNIRRVDSINDLINTPMVTVNNGTIYYVSNINKDVAILNNTVYDINYEYKPNSDTPYRYVSLVRNDNFIQIGGDRFFNDLIFVYNKDGNVESYNLLDEDAGYEVKAYILDNDGFMCQADKDGRYTIDSFLVFNAEGEEDDTNYFIIDDKFFSNRIDSGDGNGWRRLKTTDPEYKRINTITNYYEGNNGHNGNMVYDNGHEYFTYFNRLFKHAFDNELFDERCYEAFYYDADNEINTYGFEGLIDRNERVKQYQSYLIPDSKVHYFGNYYSVENGDVKFYGDSALKEEQLNEFYKNANINITKYNLKDEEMLGDIPKYGCLENPDEIDSITDQIINNKRMTIKFYLKSKDWYINPDEAVDGNYGQTELKYIDDIVMNYLTQMIPSTTIVDVKYVTKNA